MHTTISRGVFRDKTISPGAEMVRKISAGSHRETVNSLITGDNNYTQENIPDKS